MKNDFVYGERFNVVKNGVVIGEGVILAPDITLYVHDFTQVRSVYGSVAECLYHLDADAAEFK